MANNQKRMLLSLFWILLGIILNICHFAGIVEEYWSGMGVALLVVGGLQVLRQIRYRTNEDYREKMDVQTKDERNRYIANKAWAWAGYWFVLIAAIGSIVLKIAGRDELVPVAAGSVCLMMVLYWLSYLYLRKKY